MTSLVFFVHCLNKDNLKILIIFYHYHRWGGVNFHGGGDYFLENFAPGGGDFTGGKIYFYTGIPKKDTSPIEYRLREIKKIRTKHGSFDDRRIEISKNTRKNFIISSDLRFVSPILSSPAIIHAGK